MSEQNILLIHFQYIIFRWLCGLKTFEINFVGNRHYKYNFGSIVSPGFTVRSWELRETKLLSQRQQNVSVKHTV